MSEYKKKLIEVALPLEEINAACKADKDRKTGTIRNLHKWFAPMPLPAWRALLYAALIDDPEDDEKRAYHLDLIKRLVEKGADLPDEETLKEAQINIERQFPEGVPTVMDPFCGGGSTLVEAQRLGLPTFGSDLNPVPVLITRTLTELLPKIYGQQPLHPEPAPTTISAMSKSKRASALPDQNALLEVSTGGRVKTYDGYEGLKRDVTHYAERIRQQAWIRLKDCYPQRQGEVPIAWLWARTAECPNPACGIETILASSWWLSRKTGALAWIVPRVTAEGVNLTVMDGQTTGEAPPPPKFGRGSFRCIACNATIGDEELEVQAARSGLGFRMIAVAAEVSGNRIYRGVTDIDVKAARVELQEDLGLERIPATDGSRRRRFEPATQKDLYIPRQLLALTTFSDAVAGTYSMVLDDGGNEEWAASITSLLALAVGKLAQYGSTQSMIATPSSGPTRFNSGFGRNDLPMTWDFFEQNFFGEVGGTWEQVVNTALQSVRYISQGKGQVHMRDARASRITPPGLVATDPPYFDAIGYADLSDYFYVWHRRSLRRIYPDLYATVAAPKHGELTAIPAHHGDDRDAARRYFIEGFTETFTNLKDSMEKTLPMIVVYASKEQKAGSGEETRWAAILTAMIQAELEITGTWPIHGTGATRLLGMGANVVASYVAMICRPRNSAAGTCTVADFNRELRRELRPAVEQLQAAGILPVDMAQAAMGPGMQVFSRHRSILDQVGTALSVDQALLMINRALTEVLEEQEGELDPPSRFAVTLWDRHHWEHAPFGQADQLARPQGIAVDDIIRAQVAVYPKPGYVSLLGFGELNRQWSPNADNFPTAWEAVHHLADRLIDGGGVSEAGRLMAQLGPLRDPAQALVYRLHSIAARQGWTQDQERYNALIGSWADLIAEASRNHEGDGLF